jgi:PucR family transcriptional regulator, proline-responsive transcriptional activator
MKGGSSHVIPASVIGHILKMYGPEERLTIADVQYCRVSMAPSGEWRDDTVYVGLSSALGSLDQAGSACFVCIGEPSMNAGNMIVVPDSCEVHNVFGCLQEAFFRFSEYELRLMKAAVAGSYQDLIDISYRFMANPLFLLDTSYRVLALAPDADIPEDREWDHIRATGTTSPELVKTLKEEGILSIETKGLPQAYSLPGFPRSSIWFNIYLNSRYAGRVVVLDAYRSFSPEDQLATKILSEALKLKMSRDEAFQYILGKGPVYNMLRDLVTGVRFDRTVIADRLHYLSGWAKGTFRVLYVPLGSTDEQSFDFYARALEKRVDSRAVLVGNALVVVIHYKKREDISLSRDTATAFLSKNGLVGGLSNEFDELSELHGFYKQAVTCLSLSRKDEALRLYEELAVDHILSFCADENPAMMCHPGVVRLRRFDAENGTDLTETLYAYVENERSLVRTAERLRIHRNTLLYRINKITAILDVNLADPCVRLHILISQRLLDMNG